MARFTTLTAFVLVMLWPLQVSARLIGITYTFEPYPDSVVSINESTAATTDIGTTGFHHLNSLARDSRGDYYTVSGGPAVAEIIRLNPRTWIGTVASTLNFVTGVRPNIKGLAFDADGGLYALHDSRPPIAPETEVHTSHLYLIDIASGRGSLIGDTTLAGIQSIAFAPDGATLHGWSIHDGLVTIDTTSGVATDVNPTAGGTAAIQGIAFAPDGSLFGAGYELFAIEPTSGEYAAIGRTGRNVRGLAYEEITLPPGGGGGGGGGGLRNMSLVDCGPCPHCLGLERPCDPRVNPNFDRFVVWDPAEEIAVSLSRSGLGLKAEDGLMQAAAVVRETPHRRIIAITLPGADSGQPNAGAVIFSDLSGKMLHRIDGNERNEHLGLDMDARGAELVIVSTRRLLRLKHGKVVHEMAIPKELLAARDVHVAFTDDVDGDGTPEVLLGTPYALAGEIREAGQINVIGSKTGWVIDTHYGRRPGQHLGQTLLSIQADQNLPNQ